MPVNELLIPRYIVTLDYPNSPFHVKQIIEITEENKEAYSFFDDFPKVFRKLKWWENRTIDEMPEFVRFDNKILKVEGWIQDLLGNPMPSVNGNDSINIKTNWHFRNEKTLPATKQEFESQFTAEYDTKKG